MMIKINRNARVTSRDDISAPEEEIFKNCLPISSYQEYFEAIVSNDCDKIQQMLSKEKAENVRKMLNCEFDFEQQGVPMSHYEPMLPFHIAVCVGANDVTTLMIQLEVDVLKLDRTGNSVLHSLITCVFYKPEIEQKACKFFDFLTEVLDHATLAELFRLENRDGYRAVEFAAQQGTLQLLQHILNTPGVYLKQRTNKGLSQYSLIDVTEYETGARQHKSPLIMLAHLDRAKLSDPNTARVIHGPLLSTWIQSKVAMNCYVITAWVLFRFLFLATLLTLDYDSSSLRSLIAHTANKTVDDTLCREFKNMRYEKHERNVMLTLLFCIAGSILLYDVIELTYIIITKRYRVICDLRGFKTLIINSLFYRVCQTVTIMLVLMTISGNVVAHKNLHEIDAAVLRFYFYLRITLPVMVSWSLFFFLQAFPWIGDSIISIQGMVKDIVRFIVLLGIFMVPFMHVFYLGMAVTSEQGCIDDFASVGRSFYTLFRMTLNMVDITSYDIRYADVFYVMHAVYVYIVGIVLLNFLIAVMSNIQSQLDENRRLLRTLNGLSVACNAESRVRPVLGAYYACVKKKHLVAQPDGSLCIAYRTDRLEGILDNGNNNTVT